MYVQKPADTACQFVFGNRLSTVEGLALYYFDFGPNPLFCFYCFLISPKRHALDSFTKQNSCWTNSNFNAQQFCSWTVRNLPLFDRLK